MGEPKNEVDPWERVMMRAATALDLGVNRTPRYPAQSLVRTLGLIWRPTISGDRTVCAKTC